MTPDLGTIRHYVNQHAFRGLERLPEPFINGRSFDGVISVETAPLNPVSVQPIPLANVVKISVPQATEAHIGYSSSCFGDARSVGFSVSRDQARSLADRLWDAGFKPAKADEDAGTIKTLESRIASLEARNKDLVAKIDCNYESMKKLREVVDVLMP